MCRCLFSSVCSSGSVYVAWLPLCLHACTHGKHISWQQYLQNAEKSHYACILAEYRYISRILLSPFSHTLYISRNRARIDNKHTYRRNASTTSAQRAQVKERGYVLYACNCIFSSHFASFAFGFINMSNYACWWLVEWCDTEQHTERKQEIEKKMRRRIFFFSFIMYFILQEWIITWVLLVVLIVLV